MEQFLKGALEVDDASEDPNAAAPEKKPEEAAGDIIFLTCFLSMWYSCLIASDNGTKANYTHNVPH